MASSQIETNGREMRVDTTARLMRIVSPFLVVLGVAMVVFAARGAQGEALWVSGLLGPLLVGTGVYFAFLRRGLLVDRESKRVTAWWSWLGLRGSRTVEAAGRDFAVERFTRRSKESGSTDFFRILLGEELLHTISEDQGGGEEAKRIAERMADHLGVKFRGQRDCRDMQRRDALAAKYALAPLLAVVVAMFVGAVVLLLTTRR